DAGNPANCSASIGNTSASVDHTFVGDLVFTLTSPMGTRVTIINRPGGIGNSGNNFCTMTLDDEGNFPSIQNVTAAQSPITGNFSPNSPLSAFDGENANGTWILNVADMSLIDVGSVRHFSLIVTRSLSCPTSVAASAVTGTITACAGTPSANPNL